MLELRHVSCGYGEDIVLRDVSRHDQQRRIRGVIGPNGSGKTTLMRVATKVIRPAAGEVLLEGRDIRAMSYRELATRMAVVGPIDRNIEHADRRPGAPRSHPLERALPAPGRKDGRGCGASSHDGDGPHAPEGPARFNPEQRRAPARLRCEGPGSRTEAALPGRADKPSRHWAPGSSARPRSEAQQEKAAYRGHDTS